MSPQCDSRPSNVKNPKLHYSWTKIDIIAGVHIVWSIMLFIMAVATYNINCTECVFQKRRTNATGLMIHSHFLSRAVQVFKTEKGGLHYEKRPVLQKWACATASGMYSEKWLAPGKIVCIPKNGLCQEKWSVFIRAACAQRMISPKKVACAQKHSEQWPELKKLACAKKCGMC